ncbi:DEAD/DEAH box helicase [Halodesulfovibrio aestuarii]|uniref:DEAD/DEAH box helicase n=1 Tax=Halodesulfovibrio aestuarii TaxID=126333 RepID=UPI003D33A642
MLESWIEGVDIDRNLSSAIQEIHAEGPISPAILEKLAYYKRFHYETFSTYEGRIVNVMGLFYKASQPQSILEHIYSIYSDTIESEMGSRFTPVQASALKSIKTKKYFSFSAPTSSGKSYLFRDLISKTEKDIVIVVPSRALISEYYYEILSITDSRTLVLQFIDNINTEKTSQRVFIITPERGVELFKRIHELDIELFLFDEAQISEEEIRGMKFDSFVRRVDRVLPNAKKVFAHPFVSNPEAQLEKHKFKKNSLAKAYKQQCVGKIFISHKDGNFSFFSPHVECETSLVKNNIIIDTLKDNGTLLVYVSKNSIYNNKISTTFKQYTACCPKLYQPESLDIIDELKKFIGASSKSSERYSLMINMMEHGIVIHHGSIPLKARLLIEKFIKRGFAKICFSTSTLGQGINMPFDIVWVHSFINMKPLTLKNLIGRAGRTTSTTNRFDYGYTIVEEKNVPTFKSRYKEQFEITSTSLLDGALEAIPTDHQDLIEAIRNNDFADDLNLPQIQADRLHQDSVFSDVEYILKNLFENNKLLSGNDYYELPKGTRKKVKKHFGSIYTAHLRDKNLTIAEKSILSAAIPILLWQVQGKSFSEIVSLRHAYLSKKSERFRIRALAKQKEISQNEALQRLSKLEAQYSPKASTIPNKSLRPVGVFERGASVLEVSYDIIVYDTYDYLDKVISISIADPLCAALKIYFKETGDIRALALSNYIRFGTNDDKEIWLLRYGFSFEDIEWMKDMVEDVSSNKITFTSKISTLPYRKYAVIERFV